MSRSQVTKEALARSLKELAAKEPIDKITIQELVDQCGLNRQTFYYHFHDIYELLEWIFTNEAMKWSTEGTAKTWQEGLLSLFKYMQENKSFCAGVLRSIFNRPIDQFLRMRTNGFVMAALKGQPESAGLSNEDLQFIAGFYSAGFLSALYSWVEGGMKKKPKEIVAQLECVIKGDFSTVLDRFAAR